MNFRKEYVHIPVFERVSNNQHGARYKQTGTKLLKICKITATDPSEDRQLILLGDTLDVPVRFNYNSNRPYLELVSGEEVKTLK